MKQTDTSRSVEKEPQVFCKNGKHDIDRGWFCKTCLIEEGIKQGKAQALKEHEKELKEAWDETLEMEAHKDRAIAEWCKEIKECKKAEQERILKIIVEWLGDGSHAINTKELISRIKESK